MKPLDEQIASVKREIAMRKNAYPKFVLNKRMRQETADHELACMSAVLETLLNVQRSEGMILQDAIKRMGS